MIEHVEHGAALFGIAWEDEAVLNLGGTRIRFAVSQRGALEMAAATLSASIALPLSLMWQQLSI